MALIIIIIGVSGCGKTTIGKQLSEELNIPFFDADDFHPKRNVDKMKDNIPLNDDDRKPWLEVLNLKLKECKSEDGAVLACSALKESYRKTLSSQVHNVNWVFLSGTFNVIQKRIQQRENHYMKPTLLQSQFEVLEIPDYGIHIDIDNNVTQIVNQINSKLMINKKSDFGVFGLGVMGKSISLNVAENGFSVSVYNRTVEGEEEIVSDFLEGNKSFRNIEGYTNLKAFITSLKRPRKILIMIKAGPAMDAVIEQLIPILDNGDVIIDGGNSHFKDTIRRSTYLKSKQLNFVGCGVSGGEEGARKGPSIMPGGSLESYQIIAPILETIAAKDKDDKPCCTHVGTGGAGHFIKMVHNGIEYAEMQLLAEIYGLLSLTMSNDEIATVFHEWNKTELSSYLLEITINILNKKEKGNTVLDTILDKAGNKGTGSWSSKIALDLGAINTMMSSAVFARYISGIKEKRVTLSKAIKKRENSVEKPNLQQLKKAYSFARIINHVQGFELMKLASNEYNWNLNFSEIARIWTNGCIIRSEFMEKSVLILKVKDDYFNNKDLFEQLVTEEKDIRETIQYSLTHRVSLDTFWSAYNYWVSITTENLPANLIQAQRDYFGAHTYQKKSDETKQYYHTNWLKND